MAFEEEDIEKLKRILLDKENEVDEEIFQEAVEKGKVEVVKVIKFCLCCV